MTLFSHCFGGHTAAVYHLFRCPMWTSEWGLYSIMKVETGVLSSTKLLWAPVKGVTSTPTNLFFEVNDKRVMDYAQFYLIRARRGRIMKSTSHVKLDCEHVSVVYRENCSKNKCSIGLKTVYMIKHLKKKEKDWTVVRENSLKVVTSYWEQNDLYFKYTLTWTVICQGDRYVGIFSMSDLYNRIVMPSHSAVS